MGCVAKYPDDIQVRNKLSSMVCGVHGQRSSAAASTPPLSYRQRLLRPHRFRLARLVGPWPECSGAGWIQQGAEAMGAPYPFPAVVNAYPAFASCSGGCVHFHVVVTSCSMGTKLDIRCAFEDSSAFHVVFRGYTEGIEGGESPGIQLGVSFDWFWRV